MFTLGQASSYNGSHATFPSQAVVGTVVQPLVISSGSYNPTNPPSKFLTINIQGCFYPKRQGVYFFFLYAQQRSDSPVKTLRGNQKRVYSQALILCFLLTYENAVNFFFLRNSNRNGSFWWNQQIAVLINLDELKSKGKPIIKRLQ